MRRNLLSAAAVSPILVSPRARLFDPRTAAGFSIAQGSADSEHFRRSEKDFVSLSLGARDQFPFRYLSPSLFFGSAYLTVVQMPP